MIKISKKKEFNLQIIEMKYNEEEIIGFIFKFIEIKTKKKNIKDFEPKEFMPSYKNEIIFDLLNLNYIRTVLEKKSGFRNLREKEENEADDITIRKTEKKRQKKKMREYLDINEISSDEEEKVEIILTKDKILELQTRDSSGIKSFINLLPFYGNEISLIMYTPNKEKYPGGKAQEPLIKIDVSNYTKRIESRIRENPHFLK